MSYERNPIIIPEITHLLCSFVHQEDLLEFALTCKLFYQVACIRLWKTLNPKSHRTLRKIKYTLDNTSEYNKYVKSFYLSAKEDSYHLERFFFDSFQFPYLKELEFSNPTAQDHIVRPMISAARNSLVSLDLSQCYCLSTNAIQPLLAMPSHQLKSLVLYGCGKINLQVLADIIYQHSHTLQRIRLTDINDTVLNAIQSCFQLTDLGLEHCNDITLSKHALEQFFLSIQNNTIKLTHLRLRDVENLDSSHLKNIAQSESSVSLVYFDMSECNRVDEDGLFSLARECNNLHTLFLAYQSGVTNKAIKLFITNCHELKHVDVSGCRMLTDHAFFPLLRHDNLMKIKLETLNMSGLEFVTASIILQIIDQIESLNELCLGVTYNHDEADNIMEIINSGQVKFYIDIEKYYTICRIQNTPDKQKTHTNMLTEAHSHHGIISNDIRSISLPPSSTWNIVHEN